MPIEPTPSAWLTYEAAQFGLRLSYPDTLVVLPETEAPSAIAPSLLHRVRFQTQLLAGSDMVDYEPARLAVEVFDGGGRTLEEWIDAQGIDGDRTPIVIDGAPGYHIVSAMMIAPNERYALARGGYIYLLTPLGPYAEEMIQSVKLSE
jgi:hypothetical protein